MWETISRISKSWLIDNTNEHSVRPREAQPHRLGPEGTARGLGLPCTPLARRPIGRLLFIYRLFIDQLLPLYTLV